MGVLKAVSLLWGADTNVENDFDAYLNTVSYAEQSEFNRSAGAVDSLVKRLRPSKAWGKVSEEEQRAFAKNLKLSDFERNIDVSIEQQFAAVTIWISENEIYIIFSMLGVVFEVILTMVTYTLVIENKYGSRFNICIYNIY